MRALMAAILLAGCVLAAGEDIREDPPVATRPVAGDVTGRISPAGKVRELSAVCRATGKRYKPARFDAKTGEFLFKSLPGDAAYDLCIRTADGADIEGIDLTWHEARMLRLAEIRRKELGLAPEPPHRFGEADLAELEAYVRDLKDFADVRRPLYIHGFGRRAVMLVEAMRTRDFYAQRGGEVIWRTELWYFRYHYGGWERVANVERVLERHRIPHAQWRRITKVYYPELTAHVDEKGHAAPVAFEIPKALDPARGRLAGTEPVQKTKPIVIGMEESKGSGVEGSKPSGAPARTDNRPPAEAGG
ncbi:MAG TPA: hypothetical protein VM389_05315 [Phycisphaerae bacterium]|nr:hypothetical protein [Phycisphaerae bacterium]